jgi:hypothetical protein
MDNRLPPQMRLFQLATAFYGSQAVFAAADLGIADVVAGSTAEEVAAQLNAHAPSVYRLLRALVGLGIAVEDAQSRFTLTDVGQLMKSGALRDLLRMQNEHYPAWGKLTEAVRTGQIGFDLAYGKPVFDWLAEHPESARIFDNAMAGATSQLGKLVAESFDFARFPTVVDVGGGTGTLLREILAAHPVKGILADLEHVLQRAPEHERIRRVTTDFFKEVPAGDLHLMKSVLHDWNDEQALAILKNVRKAGAHLLLVEWVMPAPGEPLDARAPLFDLNMLVNTGGRERTAAEWRILLQRGGFALGKIQNLPSGISLLEAAGIA